MEREGALRAVKYLAILPSAFFFSAPMSDSLFLLLSVSCIYFARKKRYLISCALGALAAFTRSLGLTLLAPVCFELVADLIREAKSGGKRKFLIHFPALLLIPCGFALYLYINYRVSGNPFQYAVYQREHWSQSLGYFWNTASYQISYAILSLKNGEPWKFLGLWLPNLVFTFGSLAVMIAAARRVRPSYTAYFIAYFIVSVGVTWLLSAPRYLAALFPLSLALSALTKKRIADDILSAVFIIGTVMYMIAFVSHWQVF
jgi:Gpi18-like mannosyltransferase